MSRWASAVGPCHHLCGPAGRECHRHLCRANRSATGETVAQALAEARPAIRICSRTKPRRRPRPRASPASRAAGHLFGGPVQVDSGAGRAGRHLASGDEHGRGRRTARELRRALPPSIASSPMARRAEWLSAGASRFSRPAFRVTPVDTTGAGDCFHRNLAAALDAALTARRRCGGPPLPPPFRLPGPCGAGDADAGRGGRLPHCVKAASDPQSSWTRASRPQASR